jgi:hypothetical protein
MWCFGGGGLFAVEWAVTDWISGNLADSAVALVYVAYLIKNDVREKSSALTRCQATCTQLTSEAGAQCRIWRKAVASLTRAEAEQPGLTLEIR